MVLTKKSIKYTHYLIFKTLEALKPVVKVGTIARHPVPNVTKSIHRSPYRHCETLSAECDKKRPPKQSPCIITKGERDCFVPSMVF